MADEPVPAMPPYSTVLAPGAISHQAEVMSAGM